MCVKVCQLFIGLSIFEKYKDDYIFLTHPSTHL